MTSANTKHQKVRGFRLQLLPVGPDEYGLALEETNGSEESPPTLITRMNADHTRRVLPSVLHAVRGSGHAKSIVSAQRAKPVPLTEPEGVRLALILMAASPVSKARRIDKMASAVAGMSTEEAYYWYAKCTGPDANRVRRALRVFLAEE